MHNFRTNIGLLCLQVLFNVYINCMQFRCTENSNIIITGEKCTLDNYNCSELSEFSIEFTRSDYYQAIPSAYVHELWFNNSVILYLPHGIFKQLPNVQSLHLNACGLSELARYDFTSGSKLFQLSLVYNNLTALPDSTFYGAVNLIDINLAHNRISYINANAFKLLSQLTHINLSYNRIDAIPDNIFVNLPAITDIDLSHNSIVSFGELFNTFIPYTLSQLNLDYNKITNISFSSNVAINTITINNNELVAINLNRNNVKTLQVDNNKLQNIDLFISDCDLVELSLKNNSLHDFNFIRNMSNMTHLDLSFNSRGGQSIASDTFAKLSNLISLRLQSVNLVQFDFQMFSYLSHLEVLDISYNDLKTINFHMLSLLENLQRLYINGNSLTDISLTEFEFLFPNLNVIDISDNNWQCDQLADILRKLRLMNVKMSVGARPLKTNSRNIRGIRCYENSSEWSTVKKIPIVRRVEQNDHIDTLNAAELNQTKSQLSMLHQQNERLKFELTELLNGLNSDRNKMGSDANQTSAVIRNLQIQIDLLKMKLNEQHTQSDKLLRLEDPTHDNGNGGNSAQVNLAGDVKFMKIVLVMFLLVGICALALKSYRMYFKRTPYWIERLHPSTNTMATNVEDNNL